MKLYSLRRISRSKLTNQLIAIALLVCVVAGCRQLSKIGNPTVLKSRDGKFQLTVPAGCRENAKLNSAAPYMRIAVGNGFRAAHIAASAPYDLIFANILAGPLRRMAPELARAQGAGGVAILSGILARQAPAVLATYRGWGYRPRATVAIGEWRTLVLGRG